MLLLSSPPPSFPPFLHLFTPDLSHLLLLLSPLLGSVDEAGQIFLKFGERSFTMSSSKSADADQWSWRVHSAIALSNSRSMLSWLLNLVVDTFSQDLSDDVAANLCTLLSFPPSLPLPFFFSFLLLLLLLFS